MTPANSNPAKRLLVTAEIVRGETLRATGAKYGITAERARQICITTLRAAWRQAENREEPPCYWGNLQAVRMHEEYWMTLLQNLASRHGVSLDGNDIPYLERELIQRAIRSLEQKEGKWPLYVRVKQLFGTDSDMARAICYKYGFSPDPAP